MSRSSRRLPRLVPLLGPLGAVLVAGLLLPSPPVAARLSSPEPRPPHHAPGGRAPERGPRPTAHASSSWALLLRDHLASYPLAEPMDVYKFTHQSVFGPAHAVPSRDEARRYLDEELRALQPGPAGEPVVDRLGDEPPLVRLNLRPYLAAAGDAGTLVDAFAATAAQVDGAPDEMARRLETGVATLRSLGRYADAAALAAVAAARAVDGYPAVHHSAAYRAAYAPAYRVVSPALLGIDSVTRPASPAAAPGPER